MPTASFFPLAFAVERLHARGRLTSPEAARLLWVAWMLTSSRRNIH